MTDPQTIVNAHTHLELGWAHYLCPRGKGEPFHVWFEKLIRLNGEARESGNRERLQQLSVERGIERLMAAGTTHVGDISTHGASVEPLFASGLQGVVYIEVIGALRDAAMLRAAEAIGLVEEFRPKQPHNMRIGITAHAPYSTHPDAIRATAEYCAENNVPYCIHAAESPGELSALVDGSGPIYQVPRNLGFDVDEFVPGMSPIHYLNSLGALAAKPLLIHMVHATDEELDLVAASGSKIAHCPRSNALLQCGTLELDKVLARNIPVALGTDSLASSPDLDIRNEARFAISAHQGYVAPEIVESLLHRSDIF